ncbi:acyl transferase/acyl hydrolase/lysophospholipase [Ampelomyces quisqualis]|uniref:Lysophospholipase n=1 Tax=Ampelomyces quisqualis TaxID=50730 RepID=A0A6A5QDQ7_AMPQU|nr:acyl transferase/acyl hydrolase/lysophospholipase [Ampelomyces quisqualis]
MGLEIDAKGILEQESMESRPTVLRMEDMVSSIMSRLCGWQTLRPRVLRIAERMVKLELRRPRGRRFLRPTPRSSSAVTLGLRYGAPCLAATTAAGCICATSPPCSLFRPIHSDSPSTWSSWMPSSSASAGGAGDGADAQNSAKPGEQEAPPQSRAAKGYSDEDTPGEASQSAWQTIRDSFPGPPHLKTSSLGDTIIDLVIPAWVQMMPGFIRKLQNELSMAPGSLAEEIWCDANNPEANPEIVWDASLAFPLARYLDIPEATIHADDIPVIAMCGSGGGLRALVAGTSSYLSTKEQGLFDCVTYTAGVSGSCWLQTLYYSDITQRSHARLIRHLKNRLGVHIAFPPDALELLVSAPTNKYLLSALVEKAKGVPDAEFGIVDIYGALLAARLLVPKGELSVSEYDFKVSNQRRFIDDGSQPLPIYTAVRHEIPLTEQAGMRDRVAAEAKARREAWFQWFEFTPYEMWCEELSAGIPTWAMGRQFDKGRTVWRDNGLALPEVRVPLLMGIWGSAFCATLSHYYKEIRPVLTSLTGFGSLDAMISERDEDLVKVHPIDPASIPNFALGLRGLLPASCPESIFEQKNFQFMDAGMSNNLPIYPLLRPGRNVDILVAFDASADVRTDNWLKVADGYARQRGIKGWPVGAGWPPDNESMEELQQDLDEAQAKTEQQAQHKMKEAQDNDAAEKKSYKKKDLGYCNVWVGTTEERVSDNEPPESKMVEEDWELMNPSSGITVIYFPFLANPKVPGVDPKTSDFMSTWNFIYTPEQIDSVVNLARTNFSEGAESTKRTVRAVYERKKKMREQRERDERERRWRWKLAQGRVRGTRIGQNDHGDQFS